MNKTELVSAIYENLEGITKKDIALVVDVAFEQITQAMVNGQEVAIYQFGKFVPVEVGERECRNPQTGEAITVPKHRTQKFKAAAHLKQAVR